MTTLEATSRSRKWSQESGFSIAEPLVATAVMVTVVLAIFMVYDTAQQNQARGLARAAVQQDVRVAVERLARELRSAGYNPSKTGCTSPPPPTPPTIGSSPVSVTFRTDVDGDSCTDQVIYTFIPPTKSNVTNPCDQTDPATVGRITRSVQSWTGTVWNPATPTASDAARCITSLVITYIENSGKPTDIPTNIMRISVTGEENARITAAPTYTLTTDVTLRNL